MGRNCKRSLKGQNMSQSPKDIAENFIEQYNLHGPNLTFDDEQIEALARAYLDAAKEIETLKAALSKTQSSLLELEKELIHYKAEWQALRNEIRDKLYESPGFKDFHTRTIDRLNSEITKLKEENERLLNEWNKCQELAVKYHKELERLKK